MENSKVNLTDSQFSFFHLKEKKTQQQELKKPQTKLTQNPKNKPTQNQPKPQKNTKKPRIIFF